MRAEGAAGGDRGLAGLRKLVLSSNRGLTALPAGLCLLSGLEELHLADCRLTALPEAMERLTGLRTLDLILNAGLTALPVGLWSLTGLEELNLADCGLTALPEAMEGLTGLKKLDLLLNVGLTVLPAGLGRLPNLEELNLHHCPGLCALQDLQEREGLPALLAHLAAQGGEPAAAEAG
jgi:Leucine-rich repeat (LRR) protein